MCYRAWVIRSEVVDGNGKVKEGTEFLHWRRVSLRGIRDLAEWLRECFFVEKG